MAQKRDLTGLVERLARSTARPDATPRADHTLVAWILWAMLALTLIPLAIVFFVH
ncbi:MAG TPA: hypothetical protein VF292_06675 [Rhodanobacteraceae bacterium]